MMLQETVLRVFVVALGLLLCPRDDPGVEDWDELVSLQKPEENLQRGEEKLDQFMIPVSHKTTETDNKLPQKDMNKQQNQSDQRAVEEDERSNVTERGGDPYDKKSKKAVTGESGTTSLQEKYNSEPKTEQKEKHILNNGSNKEPDSLQGQHEELQEKEVSIYEKRESHVHNKKTEKETIEDVAAEWERDYLWYIWNTFSIISMIRFLRKYLRRNFHPDEEVTRTSSVCRAAEILLPDADTLHYFYDKCVQVPAEKKRREREFLEGFVNDLLDAMRTICANSSSMVIEDFHVNKFKITVYFSPPEPYRFHHLLGNNHASNRMSNLQVCGQIKLAEKKKIPNGCPCQSSAADDDDMVCLLHCDSDKVKYKPVDAYDGPLCAKDTPFLSKSKVSKWFQSTIKQAWAQISHKYEFELNIRYVDAPGALLIRFRSGKKISFNLNPVIKFNPEAHFFITPRSSSDLDTFWTLSLTNYEDRLLEHLSKRLPENSCHKQTLEIAHFLHKRQAALSGSTALKDFHFKTALMHLLLTKNPSQWSPNFVACRLRDLLDFMEKSLEKKLLTHVLIGNPLSGVIEVPTEITKAKPVNLFHPLVEHNCLYKNALVHFQEMLRNAHMLIHDYVAQRTNCANSGMF